jgi:hypothetical protein
MSQNSIIAFGLIIGFIVFITLKGELQLYLAVIGLGSAVNASSTAATASSIVPSIPSIPALPTTSGIISPVIVN